MSALYSLLAVLALVLVGFEGSQIAPGRELLTLVVPYLAFALFLVGFCARIVRFQTGYSSCGCSE